MPLPGRATDIQLQANKQKFTDTANWSGPIRAARGRGRDAAEQVRQPSSDGDSKHHCILFPLGTKFPTLAAEIAKLA